MSDAIRGRAAITGIGCTDYTRQSGRSVLHLALEACTAAVEDAGLELDAVDGIVTYGMMDTVYPRAVANDLGLEGLTFQQSLLGGGDICQNSIGLAAMAVGAGVARNVLVFRAINGRSGHRLGGTNAEDAYRHARDEEQFAYPAGWLAPAHRVAMSARRHMLKYGTTTEDYGAVAVTFRRHASMNDRALMREPMTLDDHRASRMIVDPLRLLDICLENDGACAVLVSRSDAAPSLRHAAVHILAAGQAAQPRPGRGFEFYPVDDLADDYSGTLAARLWADAGVGVDDIDVVSFYDCFTPAVVSQLEGYGFCPQGEGGAFVSEGRIGLGGDIPANTHGGMLSESYIHGLNGVLEVVSQLRGDAGERQVPGAATALATGYGNTTGCAVVLGL